MLPREAIGPRGQIVSGGGSLPVFQKKQHIATCDFIGGGGPDHLSPPLDPSMSFIHNVWGPLVMNGVHVPEWSFSYDAFVKFYGKKNLGDTT